MYKRHCSAYVVILVTIAQTTIVFITLLLEYETVPFVIQTTSFFMLLIVFLADELLYPQNRSLTYKVSLIAILPATIISETLCINQISNVINRIDSRIMRVIFEFNVKRFYKLGNRAIKINAAILSIVNRAAMNYLLLKLIALYTFCN